MSTRITGRADLRGYREFARLNIAEGCMCHVQFRSIADQLRSGT